MRKKMPKKATPKATKKVARVVKKTVKKTAKKSVKKVTKKPKPSTNKNTEEGKNDGLLDIESWQVEDSQNQEASIETDYVIDVAKPNSQKYFQVRDGREWQMKVKLVEYKPYQEFSLVLPEVAKNAGENTEIAEYRLYLTVNEFGHYSVWPVHVGKGSWHESRRLAVKDATGIWIRMKANIAKEEFFTLEAPDDIASKLGKPIWPPDLTFREIVSIAFAGRVIDDVNHPLLKKLRGKKRS